MNSRRSEVINSNCKNVTVQLWAELHSSQPYLASRVDELGAGAEASPKNIPSRPSSGKQRNLLSVPVYHVLLLRIYRVVCRCTSHILICTYSFTVTVGNVLLSIT